ncbi:hypothetical protein H9L15_07100 [Sphingomonas daechungensis]|uniref:CHASE2 domain-containing protein n=1 Tax=Sphingomonas daechungensis TaxID=1176646 RepID=A0ABX6T5D2_9SPHN|nr:hypothetical protein [Sphingomonas daechungensis]QNP44235.1 hypothetical protein H9L15_07100 [Sphingomonas daechungensis]
MPAIAVCAVVTAVVVGIGYVAPHWVAPYVPMSWERKLGNAMVGDFGSSKCDDPAGQAALEKLAETLEPGATEGPDRVRIVALDFPIFNAVALPGETSPSSRVRLMMSMILMRSPASLPTKSLTSADGT